MNAAPPASATQQVIKIRRDYNTWVANETLEDYALRFTPRSFRKWSEMRVANTAFGASSFLVLEAVGLRVPVGSQCLIANGKKEPVLAEVVGFSSDRAFLMPAGDTRGLSSGASVIPLAPYRPVPRLGQVNKAPASATSARPSLR